MARSARHPLVPQEGPGRGVGQAGSDLGDVYGSLACALVAEYKVLGSQLLGGIEVARWAFDEQPYLGSGTDLQEPGPEPCLPGAEHRGEPQRDPGLVRAGPSGQGQGIGGPRSGDQADPRGLLGRERRMQEAGAERGVLPGCQARELPGVRCPGLDKAGTARTRLPAGRTSGPSRGCPSSGSPSATITESRSAASPGTRRPVKGGYTEPRCPRQSPSSPGSFAPSATA